MSETTYGLHKAVTEGVLMALAAVKRESTPMARRALVRATFSGIEVLDRGELQEGDRGPQ